MERLEELAGLIDRFSGTDGVHMTPVPRLALIRAARPTEPLHQLHQPAICLVVQGKKQVLLGERVFTYDNSRFLAVSVDVPVIGHVTEASAKKPYLCMRLDLDRAAVSELALALGPPPAGDVKAGLAVCPVTPDLLDAAIRLVRLLDSPRDIAVLAPLAERELLYRLLVGDQGVRLRQIAHADSKLAQINRAIAWIKDNFRAGFSIDALASEARMSASALHLHFKQVTAMSPLQYQKHLRLQEARRLILADGLDAASAAHEVGYESASQFSREYRRLFGAPPLRDAQRLREAGLPLAATP